MNIKTQTEEVFAHGYDYLKEDNKCKYTQGLLMPQDIHVPALIGYGKRKSSFFIKIFFQNYGGLIAALNHKRQCLIIIIFL